MDETFLDDIFSDLVDEDTKLHSFIESFQEKVPGVKVQLYKGGIVFPSKKPLDLFISDDMVNLARQHQGFISHEDSRGFLYGCQVNDLGAVVFFRLPDSVGNLIGKRTGEILLHSLIDLVLSAVMEKELEVENRQFSRKIEVLRQQHEQLIENNYRQHNIIQEKDKEYAARLKDEIRRQTTELREANARLVESSRLKSEFLANMSHEIRTPLNAIIGFADLLKETELIKEQKDYATVIVDAAGGLKALINDILDLAKIEAGRQELHNEEFDLPALLSNISSMFGHAVQEKNIAFESVIDADLPSRVVGDRNRIKQILVNLCGNGVKFTRKGKVAMRVVLEHLRDGKALIRFSVEDTGIGIPLNRQNAIFEKFTQADGSTTREFGGTGLGLTISKKIIELMGGNLSLQSELHKGSTFSFAIEFVVRAEPVKKTAPGLAASTVVSQPTAVGAPGSAEPTGKGIVLLVEDNLVNQRLASILVKKQGYQVAIANNGLEALEIIKNMRVNLVLMDLQMPKMGGLEATQKIRELEKSPEKENYAALKGRLEPLPIAGLTAHAMKEHEEECYAVGMNAFLAKPVNKDKLFNVLDTYIRNGNIS